MEFKRVLLTNFAGLRGRSMVEELRGHCEMSGFDLKAGIASIDAGAQTGGLQANPYAPLFDLSRTRNRLASNRSSMRVPSPLQPKQATI